MPMGVSEESLREMTIGGLRELQSIASQMMTLTSIPLLVTEYALLENVVAAEILRREAQASVALQLAVREHNERQANLAQDKDRMNRAKQLLADRGIDITLADPNTISNARLYHLATLLEAAESLASKNPYLTKKAPRSVGKSQLPSKQLQQDFNEAEKRIEDSVEYIEKIVNDKIEKTKELDRIARSVALPPKFKQTGASVDYGTFIYPGAGTILYSTASTYLLHPNRTLVHVKDEIPKTATPAQAGAYLAALIKGCVDFIQNGTLDGTKQRVYGFTPRGRSFYWIMIGEAYDKKKQGQTGYKGQIHHIDSGYANSLWQTE